ncbi:MAG: DUF6106 family protein [Oscillospiraceae bacterium]|nr:DUF6106 family protein [Oscillospiraceae bacterium]
MDVILEQLVARKKTPVDMIKIMATFLASVVAASALVFIVAPYLGTFATFVALSSVGVLYGGYQLAISYNIEYEYIIINNEIDVDKIIARRRRKRILTTKITNWEKFGIYEKAKCDFPTDTIVDACADSRAANNYCALFNHNKLGKTLLIFSPNEKMLENVQKYITSAMKIQID